MVVRKFYDDKKPKNYELQDLVAYGKQCLDYLITDHLDPKDGTNHEVHLSVCAEIVQEQLKEIYKIFEAIDEVTTYQTTLIGG